VSRLDESGMLIISCGERKVPISTKKLNHSILHVIIQTKI